MNKEQKLWEKSGLLGEKAQTRETPVKMREFGARCI